MDKRLALVWHFNNITEWSWMVVMSLKPTQLQFCFCPPTELNFHQDAKPEQENEFIVIGMSIFLTAAAAGLVWPLKMVSEAPVSTDQIWTWDKMKNSLRHLMGSHRAVPSTTSDIGGVRTEGETTPITTNVKTFTSHLNMRMIFMRIKTTMILMMRATMMMIMWHQQTTGRGPVPVGPPKESLGEY